jgi:glycyl-tRNA synthetase beta chain
MPELCFEVGVEELPAGEAGGAVDALARLAVAKLSEARLSHGAVRAMGTPRRLALMVSDLAERQTDLSDRLVGPPMSGGEKAAQGFAKKHGVEVSALVQEEGRWTLHRTTPGLAARDVMAGLLRDVCLALPWKKAMRWGYVRDRFARPVLWLLALLDGEIVPVEFGGVCAGAATRGHRFLAPDPVTVRSVAEYRAALEAAHVILDPAARRARVWDELLRVAREADLRVRADDELLTEVTWLVEEPLAVGGRFAERYLAIPEPVIVSAMRGQQRYFAMLDAQGRLANRFVAVAGTRVRDPDVVRRGNERVLLARLEDARFFLEEDGKVPLARRAEGLRHVVFQRQVGTVYEKVERVAGLAIQLGMRGWCDPDLVKRAARIYKADLLTHMVGEFPDLQGVMGREYALREGEPREVADAVRESYQPRSAGDDLPATPSGAVLSAADRLDTLVGCFSAGLQPTGAADPYALRRAAIGLCRIVLDRGWRASLGEMVGLAAARYAGRCDGAAAAVGEFVMGRFRGVVAAEASHDVIEAVLAAGGDDLVDLGARLRALEAMRRRDDFLPLAVAFKRVANILKGQAKNGNPEPALFREEAERRLFVRATEFGGESTDYGPLLFRLATLKPEVDRFFDDVLVMDEDERVRKNRLALLGMVNRLFLRIADFRQIAT